MANLSDPKVVWARRSMVQIIDCREMFEFSQGHITGAVNVSLGELMAGGGEFEEGFPVVVVCKSGDRSELAALMLQTRGFEAYNLSGGLEAWIEGGLPLDSAEGKAGHVA